MLHGINHNHARAVPAFVEIVTGRICGFGLHRSCSACSRRPAAESRRSPARGKMTVELSGHDLPR